MNASLGCAILVLLIVVGGVFFLLNNMATELRAQRNIVFSYSWVGQVAGFDISESLISYDSTGTYGRAIVVGILNTLQVALAAIVFSTILGLFGALSAFPAIIWPGASPQSSGDISQCAFAGLTLFLVLRPACS